VPPSVARKVRTARSLAGRVRAGSSYSESTLTLGEVPAVSPRLRDPQAAAREFGEFCAGYGSMDDEAWESASLEDKVASVLWYHTIELPGGLVTRGLLDHRPLLPHYGLPGRLDEKRALDVGTADGFWAFEMERRGAKVTAVDVETVSGWDCPPAVRAEMAGRGIDRRMDRGFRVAHSALGSTVERVGWSVYDLSPEAFGTFDLVHAADILLHLESPTRALRAIRSVCSDTLVISDCYDPDIPEPGLARYLGGWSGMLWWSLSLPTLVQMVNDAGFREVTVTSTYSLVARGSDRGPWRACLVARV
jgi:tRNA (mo5U34)-methyltransferase